MESQGAKSSSQLKNIRIKMPPCLVFQELKRNCLHSTLYQFLLAWNTVHELRQIQGLY